MTQLEVVFFFNLRQKRTQCAKACRLLGFQDSPDLL